MKSTLPLLLATAGLAAGCRSVSDPKPDPGPQTIVPELSFEDSILYRVDGQAAGDWFGYAVAALGDVDGDQVPDFAVGAHQNLNFGHGEPGYVHVYSGASGERLHVLTSVGSLQIDGRDDHFGHSLTAIEDLDGDSFPDIVIGSYLFDGEDENTGGLFFFSGATGNLFRVLANTLAGDRLGWFLRTIDDVDGDGLEDLLLGVQKTEEIVWNEGSAQILSSRTFEILTRANGPGHNAHLGTSVAALGDVDGDGVPDFASGAFMYSLDGERGPASEQDVDWEAPWFANSERGFAGVYSGAGGQALHEWRGSAPNDRLGFSITGLGDIDGDGLDDVAVGAIQSGWVGKHTGPGYVRLYSTRGGRLIAELQGSEAGDQFGWSVTDVGDRDGDGTSDLLVGATRWVTVTDEMSDRPGRVHLISGATRTEIATAEGLAPNDLFGACAADLGDIDGDGLSEILIGAPENVAGQTRPGYAVVVSGRYFERR